MKTTGNSGMSIKEAAQGLGKCQMFVRWGLQQGVLPFGVAIRPDGKHRWNYYISRERFEKFVDGTMPLKEDPAWAEYAKNNLRRNDNE